MSRPCRALGVLALLVALALGMAGAAADPAAAQKPPRVVLAFLPVSEKPQEDPAAPPVSILDRLASRPALALGLLGATQGTYVQEQAFLDMTQGTRTSTSTYRPRTPPELAFYPEGRGGLFQRWLDTLDRAETAPAEIHPGLLASLVPGGATYVGVTGRRQLEAIVAADRAGRVARVSIGNSRDVAQRALAELERSRFVVVGLPTGPPGGIAMDVLITNHEPGDLLLVVQTPPDYRAPQLLPTGVLGLGTPGGITSQTTHLDGIVAGIDILPTVLGHLGIRVPDDVKGQDITVGRKLSAGELQQLKERFRVLGARRFPALQLLLVVWLTIVLVGGVIADRRGTRAALRIGALGFLWLLPVLLITASLTPSKSNELALIAILSFGLGALTDLLVKWPRGPIVPGLVCTAFYTVDLFRGSDLIVQSLLGPNPRFGSRYYGIGNELESTLPLVLFVALAALLMGRGRSRTTAAVFGIAGVLYAGIIGAGRLGADVGGVITIGVGTAVCVVLLLPGTLTKKRIALVLGAPVLGVLGLAVVDLLTGGNGHFTRTVLRADGESAIWDIVQRRFELAAGVFGRGLMPFAAGIAALAIAYAIRHRERLYAPLEGDEVWRAGLLGGLGAAIAGALSNDSGPVLLVLGVFVLAIATAYVRGDPRLGQHDPGPGADGATR